MISKEEYCWHTLAIPHEPTPDIVTVLQGVRRCGKSTVLHQLPRHWQIPLKRCQFCNFEDTRITDHLTPQLLTDLVHMARAETPRGTLLFLWDEIQVVEGFERWLRTQLDRPQNNIFVITGSNAALLSGELGSLLTGRHLTFELFPFSFDEFATYTGITSAETYLERGGFPRSLSFTPADLLLQQYFYDIVSRDIRPRVGARSETPLLKLFKMVFESIGSECSLRKLAMAAGISPEAARQYLEAGELAYLIFKCPYFAFSEKKQLAHPPKYYAIDTGLRRAIIGGRVGKDYGKSLENLVFLYLKQKFGDVSYWRGQHEVDFVVQTGPRIVPIQVTMAEALPRHEQALSEFYAAFPQAEDALTISMSNIQNLLAGHMDHAIA